ncbi:M20 family metallopeptidase [Georgenia sp. AZ-5]|uniref:M20 family metallopeptidase n=1 Tax=Georgenia sp. AZ-5 TaxID=3367526 RepID=UPI0037546ECD
MTAPAADQMNGATVDLANLVEETSGVRSRIARAVAARAEDVLGLSRRLHADPELSFEEHRASAAISALLERSGFTVERGAGGLPTAFTATAGGGRLTVGICVEYDALPGVGHACGHNLIAGAGVGAALGLLPVADELGITVKVIGTPAEEHGGGKSILLERGVFDGVAMAMMVHPFQEGLSYNPVGTTSQAVGRYRATFRGRASHAATAPHLGVNAADAAVIAQVAVGLLRQQLPGDHRVALVVSEAGRATNIIPDTAVVDFECRAFTLPEYEALIARVRRCFEAGALATGAVLEMSPTEPLYEPLVHDEGLCARWGEAIGFFGHDVEPGAELGGGSTDMGNVSRVIPSIHPWVGVPGCGVPIHTHEFAAVADSPQAYDLMLECAIAMGWTAAAVMADPGEVQRLLDGAGERRA